MSASARLREFHPFGWYEAETQDGRKLRLMPAEIVDALPEIVAVVEAAERAEALLEDVFQQEGLWSDRDPAQKALLAALADLEEKLKR